VKMAVLLLERETSSGKLLCEREGAQSYLLPDRFETLASTPQIGFRKWTPNSGAIANTVDCEVEHDSSTRRDRYAARKPLVAHETFSGEIRVGEDPRSF
jgi:hypothetical protein